MALTIQQLTATHANWDQLEQALAQLTEARWLLRTGKGWALATPPDRILLRDVFEHLVFQPSPKSLTLTILVEQPQLNLSQWLTRQS